MTEKDDRQLLELYVTEDSNEAFETLVQRHVALVYSVALRRLGVPHQAEEVTQAVFITLARKAKQVARTAVLSGWLYQTTRLTTANLVRSEVRRARRERDAYMEQCANDPNSEESWQRISGHLDDAIGSLREKDRNAVLLRFFNGKTLAEVGAALGISEDAAKQRILRALEKLRTLFARRGVTLSSSVIASLMTARSVQAAPEALSTNILAVTTGAAVATTTVVTLIKGVLKLMAWTQWKLALGVSGVFLAAGIVTTGILSLAQHDRPNRFSARSQVAAEPSPVEPEFEGRTLREWIAANPPLNVISHDDIVAYRKRALLAMGQPAVVFLHWMIRNPAHALAGRDAVPADRANGMNVVLALGLIGPAAREVVPDLVRLWTSEPNPPYATYNGYPFALSAIGVDSSSVLDALSAHMQSRDRLHAALCALALWRLKPEDPSAKAILRRELTAKDGEVHTRYALLEAFWRQEVEPSAFATELRQLTTASLRETPTYASMGARAAWRFWHEPAPARSLIEQMGQAAVAPDATREAANSFTAAALDLAEVPGVRELAQPFLDAISQNADENAAEFATKILSRLTAQTP